MVLILRKPLPAKQHIPELNQRNELKTLNKGFTNTQLLLDILVRLNYRENYLQISYP